jgi:hypothetical protein
MTLTTDLELNEVAISTSTPVGISSIRTLRLTLSQSSDSGPTPSLELKSCTRMTSECGSPSSMLDKVVKIALLNDGRFQVKVNKYREIN